MKFLQVARFDASDDHVYETAAQVDELAVTGSFAFSFSEDDPAELTGKPAQAFRHGFLGVESFGWTTVVRIVEISDAEFEFVVRRLAQHLVNRYGAPSLEEALPIARQEAEYAAGLCEHPPGVLLTVERHADAEGIHEAFKHVRPRQQTADWQGHSGEVKIWDMFPEK